MVQFLSYNGISIYPHIFLNKSQHSDNCPGSPMYKKLSTYNPYHNDWEHISLSCHKNHIQIFYFCDNKTHPIPCLILFPCYNKHPSQFNNTSNLFNIAFLFNCHSLPQITTTLYPSDSNIFILSLSLLHISLAVLP